VERSDKGNKRVDSPEVAELLSLGGGTLDLAWLAHGSRNTQRVLAVLIAFLDESGTHDARGLDPGSEIAGFGGAVADAKQWDLLEADWSQVLKEFQAPWYHARSCEEGEKPFKGWPITTRRELTRRLIEIFNEYPMLRVVGTTSVRDYDAIIPPLVKEQIYKHPWHLGFQHCIDQALKWLSNEQIGLVLDCQNEFDQWAKERFDQIKQRRPEPRLVALTFASKEQQVSLQVADLIVFYMTKWKRRLLFKKGTKLPRPALHLIERARPPHEWFAMEHFGQQRLAELAERGADEIKLLSGN
jgi:hypothetical protein